MALSPAALGAGAEGADVHAHRRARGGPDDLASGDAPWRAQLGLPLLLDARRLVHAVGAARARSELGGRRLRAVRRRHGAQRGRLAADHVRDQGPEGPQRVHARPPQGLRGRAPGAYRQRRLRPAPERRVRGGARLGLPALQAARSHPRAAVAGADRPGALRRAGVEAARPGHLGGAGRAPALRQLEADVLGGDGSRRAAGRTARRVRARPALAGAGGRDPRGDPGEGGGQARGVPPALRHGRARRLQPAGCCSCASCRPRTNACARP